jgi:hypothetical protein
MLLAVKYAARTVQFITMEEKAEPKVVSAEQRRRMRQVKYGILLMFAVCIAVGVFIYVQNMPPPAHKYDSLAKCIAQSSTTFYGAFWCPHCAEQKTKFGTGAQYLPYVECSLPDATGRTQVCIDAGVKNYPTWVFKDGSRLVGTQSVSTLSQKTGCALPSST